MGWFGDKYGQWLAKICEVGEEGQSIFTYDYPATKELIALDQPCLRSGFIAAASL